MDIECDDACLLQILKLEGRLVFNSKDWIMKENEYDDLDSKRSRRIKNGVWKSSRDGGEFDPFRFDKNSPQAFLFLT